MFAIICPIVSNSAYLLTVSILVTYLVKFESVSQRSVFIVGAAVMVNDT